MPDDRKPGLSLSGLILIAFTLVAMTALGGIAVKALLDGFLKKSATAEHVTDEEAYKLCIFSHRSPETCKKMIADRAIERVIEKNRSE